MQNHRTQTVNTFVLLRTVLAVALSLSAMPSCAQQQTVEKQSPTTPAATLAQALSAACRQDSAAFAGFLIADNAAAYRALPGPQQTEFMRRLVLLDDPGRPLLSTTPDGHTAIRCETPSIATQINFGDPRTRDNLSFVPIAIVTHIRFYGRILLPVLFVYILRCLSSLAQEEEYCDAG